MYINYYYDLTPDKSISQDQEGNLCMLCDDCAKSFKSGEIEFASSISQEVLCENCDSYVDPESEINSDYSVEYNREDECEIELSWGFPKD